LEENAVRKEFLQENEEAVYRLRQFYMILLKADRARLSSMRQRKTSGNDEKNTE
jgi:hypothetical protein